MKPTTTKRFEFLLNYASVMLMLISFNACVQTHSMHRDQMTGKNLIPQDELKSAPDMELTQMMRMVKGLSVNGHREFATIEMRLNTGRNDTGCVPLFIVNNMEFGHDYMTLYRTLNPTEIESIHALNDTFALSTYGSRGQNGVVVIQLRK